MIPSVPVLGCRVAALSAALLLCACGGGGSGGGSGVGDGAGDAGGDAPPGDPWEARTAQSAPLAQRCAEPRSGRDPYNGNQPYPDLQGTLDDERSWLATYMDEVYLWYDEIPNVDDEDFTVTAYGSPAAAMEAYFYSLLTPATTPSGRFKDEFSFVYPTDLWNALSQSGESVGYGMLVALVAPAPPREAVVAFVEQGSPAADAGIGRGAQIVAIDGEDLAYGDDIDTLNNGLFPASAGESHSFRIRPAGTSSTREVTLTAQVVTTDPVPLVRTIDTASGRVGYLLFNDHAAIAEGELYRAVQQLASAGISDLVLDLRYNGGGYLDIASELAYMIAGASTTSGKTFERLAFNDHNPLGATGDAVTPFHSHSLGFDDSLSAGTVLPALDLSRVFVLSGPGTCSASEAIINGLKGVDVQVMQIGGTSCGKPYGFYAWDNCGTSYFPIEFVGVNHKGQGDYADGIAPQCEVADDYAHALGDTAENQLATALAYRQSGSCPSTAKAAATPARLLRSPLREFAWRRRR